MLSKTHGRGLVKGETKFFHAQVLKGYSEIKAYLQIFLTSALDKEYLATSAPVLLEDEKVSQVCRELNHISLILHSKLLVTEYTKFYSYLWNFNFVRNMK